VFGAGSAPPKHLTPRLFEKIRKGVPYALNIRGVISARVR
jgi:hypothetical protein